MQLAWTAEDYQHLGEALRYCGALEELMLYDMEMGDADAAAMLVGEPLPSLQTLALYQCEKLTALPELLALTSLKKLNLYGCSSLAAQPDVSALTSLKYFFPPDHLKEEEAYLNWKEQHA